MAVTLATFVVQYPEFAATDSALATAKLAEAEQRTDARVFGDDYDAAVYLLTAHLISIAPFGQQARLESNKAETTYLVERKRLSRERAGGPHVIRRATCP